MKILLLAMVLVGCSSPGDGLIYNTVINCDTGEVQRTNQETNE